MQIVGRLLAGRKVPVFILGCQRSGTTICQNVFLEARGFGVFREGSRKAMTENWRLRPKRDIDRLIKQTRRSILLFKPINDSQWADYLLGDFENARIIWIYRSVFDTANSAVAKWQGSQRDMVKWIGDAFSDLPSHDEAMRRIEEKPNYGIYAERLPEDAIEQLVRWTRAPLSEHTGAAILWYLRNRIVKDLGLMQDPRVLLVNYEEFVQGPVPQLERMCHFMGAKFEPELADGVFSSSIGKADLPDIDPDVRAACIELTDFLDTALEEQGGRVAEARHSSGGESA